MEENSINLLGLHTTYPEHQYSTQSLIETLGNKLSDKVKENIKQLGVDQRFLIRPLEQYLDNKAEKIKSIKDGEPISDICTSIGKKCLNHLDLKPDDISCLIAASEDNDFLSPGLAPVVATKLELSNFIPHYNIQGMACSTLPKLLELGKNFVRNENDKVLVVISGCNSGWYLPHLADGKNIWSPSEIDKNQHDREIQIKKWVATMFSFLFGDGAAAFVLSKSNLGTNVIKIGKISHAVNFDRTDYRKACVRLIGNTSNHLYEYELTASPDILERSLNYSKKVLMRFLGKEINQFDEDAAQSFMSQQNKVMIHTGSLKILDGFKNLYKLKNEQIQDSYKTLRNYGNLTGVSIPTVMDLALNNGWKSGKGLLIGITMGFGLDIVQVEKIN